MKPEIVTIIPHSNVSSEARYYIPDAYDQLSIVPPDWWVCVLDPDVMLPPFYAWQKLLHQAIAKEPEAGMFVAMTNRLMREKSGYQMVGEEYEWHTDIKDHLLLGWEMARNPGATLRDVTDIDKEGFKLTSGFFQCFTGETWRRISPMESPLREVDWEIHRRIRDLGKKVFLVTGLYVFHYSHYDKDLLGLQP